jgi:hypothetical protein
MARNKTPVEMVHVILHVTRPQAVALAEASRRFQYADAQHLLRFTRNIKADHLCEAVTLLQRALSAAGVKR